MKTIYRLKSSGHLSDSTSAANSPTAKSRPTKQHAPRVVARRLITTNAPEDISAAKAQDFLDWLDKQIKKGVLGEAEGPARKVVGSKLWTSRYIRAGYTKGVGQALGQMKKTDAWKKYLLRNKGQEPTVVSAFSAPVHVDALGYLYTRTFTDLKGITSAMSTDISRTLAEGMSQGWHADKIAAHIHDRVEKVGRSRARTMARTEITRAHHKANLNEMRAAGIEGVHVVAEWEGTPDDKMCEKCGNLVGKRFTIRAIEGMIPAHPNCRCVAIPAVDAGEGLGDVEDAAGNVNPDVDDDELEEIEDEENEELLDAIQGND